MKIFYSYKNKMPENDQNLMGNSGATEVSVNYLSSIENLDTISQNQETQSDSSQNVSMNNLDTNNDLLDSSNSTENVEMTDFNNLGFEAIESPSMQIDNTVFLDSGDDSRIQTRPVKDREGIGKYLRLFFWASILSILGIIAIVLLFSFNTFISKASQNTVDSEYVEYVKQYKDKLGKIKSLIGMNNVENYKIPSINDEDVKSKVNEIINATDIDYMEKKDLLAPFVSDLVHNSEGKATQIEVTKQDIAKQGFLPEELSQILSEKQAIDTIQRSLNALEVIKFSTATKVFSYMDSALATISEMVRVSGSSIDAIGKLLNQISSRGEKDISAYVYMCYLNPFETSVNCDTIGDLDLYYNSIIKDDSLNIRLFKNVMNAINQILEKEDTALFSITFNGFNAQAKDITFSVEVYTNQNDERSLMAKGKKNPNIFILTNIVNLLKQSSFIIGSNILTKQINVDTRTITLGGLSTKVNYSNMDFTVPIQRSTEREIFDYIDLDNVQKLLNSVKKTTSSNTTTQEIQEADISEVKSEEPNDGELSNNTYNEQNTTEEDKIQAQELDEQNKTVDEAQSEDEGVSTDDSEVEQETENNDENMENN